MRVEPSAAPKPHSGLVSVMVPTGPRKKILPDGCFQKTFGAGFRITLMQMSNEPVDILIVDDRPDKVMALQAILSPLNENLVTASSGAQALRLLLKRDFAVLLLDVQMPDIDGFERQN